MIQSYIQIAELLLSENYIISREYEGSDRDVPGYTVTDKKTGREKHFVDVSREGGTTKVSTYNPRRKGNGGDRKYTGERAKRVLRAIQRMKKNKKNTVVK